MACESHNSKMVRDCRIKKAAALTLLRRGRFPLIFADQKSKRNPSCINRELPFMLVIVPADDDPRLELGKLRLG